MRGFALLLMIVVSTPVGAQEPGPVEFVEAFHDALRAGNRDEALGLLAPEVVIFESGGAEMSREEYASHHLGGDIAFSSAVERDVVDRSDAVLGELAYVLSRTRTTGTFREREINATGVETMLLRRFDEGWRIVHIHWSSRRQ